MNKRVYISPITDDALMDVLCQDAPQFDPGVISPGTGGPEVVDPHFGIPVRRLYI